MPMVRALADCMSGRAHLVLRNEFTEALRAEVFLVAKGDGVEKQSSIGPVVLDPDQISPIDLTEELTSLFECRERRVQTGTVTIRICLNPELLEQPPPGMYRVTFENGSVTDFYCS